jgi:hypothetical protein
MSFLLPGSEKTNEAEQEVTRVSSATQSLFTFYLKARALHTTVSSCSDQLEKSEGSSISGFARPHFYVGCSPHSSFPYRPMNVGQSLTGRPQTSDPTETCCPLSRSVLALEVC